MPNSASVPETYSQVKERLDQIVQEVNSQDLSLDDALDLYEEAVKLGLRASDLVETDLRASAEDEEGETAPATA